MITFVYSLLGGLAGSLELETILSLKYFLCWVVTGSGTMVCTGYYSTELINAQICVPLQLHFRNYIVDRRAAGPNHAMVITRATRLIDKKTIWNTICR